MRSVRSLIELHTNVGIQKWNTQKMASNDTPVSFRFISNENRQLETVFFPGYKLLNMYVCTFIANGWLWESTDRYHEFNLINLLKRCRHFNFNLVRCWVALDLQWDKENFSHCWMQILKSILPKIATSKRETKNTYIDSIYTEKRIPNCQRRFRPLCMTLVNVRGVHQKSIDHTTIYFCMCNRLGWQTVFNIAKESTT